MSLTFLLASLLYFTPIFSTASRLPKVKVSDFLLPVYFFVKTENIDSRTNAIAASLGIVELMEKTSSNSQKESGKVVNSIFLHEQVALLTLAHTMTMQYLR